jgi:hypothetical protein
MKKLRTEQLVFRRTILNSFDVYFRDRIRRSYGRICRFWSNCRDCIVIVASIRIIDQYERGVVLTLGKYTGFVILGSALVVPFIQRMMKVDIRSTPIDVPKQEVITKDNVTVGVDAVVYLPSNRCT